MFLMFRYMLYVGHTSAEDALRVSVPREFTSFWDDSLRHLRLRLRATTAYRAPRLKSAILTGRVVVSK